MKYIGIGNLDKYHIYILIALLCEFLINLLTGLNNANNERPARIFPFRAKIQNHKFLDNFIQFAAIFFGGLIFYYFEGRNKKKENDEITIQDYEKMKTKIFGEKSESIAFNLILIGVLFPFIIFFQDFSSSANSSMSFWTLEILNIGVISYFMFKNKIYKHKKIAIYIMLGVTIITIVELLIPSTKHKNYIN